MIKRDRKRPPLKDEDQEGGGFEEVGKMKDRGPMRLEDNETRISRK